MQPLRSKRFFTRVTSGKADQSAHTDILYEVFLLYYSRMILPHFPHDTSAFFAAFWPKTSNIHRELACSLMIFLGDKRGSMVSFRK